jgi:signal transduction histidine kinase
MEAFAHYPLPRFTAIFAPTFRGQGIIRSDDITKDERYGKNAPHHGMPKGHLPVKSYLALPVISRSGKVLGGLFFGHSTEAVFTQSTEQMVSDIATQAAIAIDNAFLFEASLADRKELALINQELEKTNKELVRTNLDLDNFVYTASHDLKAPIANMEGLTSLLIKKMSDRMGEKEKHLLGLLEDSVSKLRKIIRDLTEITKVQKDLQDNAELIFFEEMIREISADIAPQVEESEVKMKINLSVKQIAYSRKNLRSILYNLLSNAIKYRSSGQGAQVEITTEDSGAYILLTVKDNGLGIASDQIHKLFTMFKRLHTHVEGTGIGLYIVKRIIENRGGHIEVESHLGEGTTFKVYFAKEIK